MKGFRQGPHFTRYVMYKQLGEVLRSESRYGRILSISHSTVLCGFFDLSRSQIVEANYPQYDMRKLPFADNEFDHVVSDQVLEHVEGDPQAAIDESYRVLKPGGLAVLTTCFINPIHAAPNDFWRFTPNALRLLCGKFSRIIEVGGWGNPYVWLLFLLDLRYEGIPEKSWHPIHMLATRNNPDWPITVWIVAQK